MAYTQTIFQAGDTITAEWLTNTSGMVASLLKQIKVVEYATSDASISANGLASLDANITLDGYTPVLISQCSTYNSADGGALCSNALIYNGYIKKDGSVYTGRVNVRNTGTATAKIYAKFQVLYIYDNMEEAELDTLVTEDEIKAIIDEYLDDLGISAELTSIKARLAALEG